jgi:ATP-dependent protease ClpP protease subunit
LPNWREVLDEIRDVKARAEAAHGGAVDFVRRSYLEKLYQHTQRNVIAYYSGWLSKPSIPFLDIGDEDKNGFMMAVHGMDRRKGLDLILHTPGGAIGATHSLVDYLRRMFDDNVRAIVPQIAMSAGTMIACCCKEILMTRHSNLGPIDPHVRGLPAQGVIQEFKRACKEIAKDRSRTAIWQTIIAQYEPSFLSRCENAIQWSNGFVQDELVRAMFRGDADAVPKAKSIVKKLSDFSKNRTHERHIHFDECKSMGLRVRLIEDEPELQDLVLTVHHCFMHSLMNTSAAKMIENQHGVAFVKMAQA